MDRKVNALRFHLAFLESIIQYTDGVDCKHPSFMEGYAPAAQDTMLESLRLRLPCSVETAQGSGAVSPRLVNLELRKTRQLLQGRKLINVLRGDSQTRLVVMQAPKREFSYRRL